MELINFEKFEFNFVEVILNNSCPLDCSYCFLQNQGNKEFMNKQTLVNIFNMCKQSQEIYKKEYISVMFALKEPLISWNIIKQAILDLPYDLIDYNIFLTINTNGVLLNKDIISFCRKYCIDLHISLDGPQDIHDRGRSYRNKSNQSSWQKIMDIIYQYPNYDYMSFMTTLHMQDIDRVEEIFNFMSNLPISKWVYSLNKFDNWNFDLLEKQIKSFIKKATPQQLEKTAIRDTASAFPNLNVSNSLKIFPDGNIVLQPPIHNEGAKKGAFTSMVTLGNVNNIIKIPNKYQLLTNRSFEIKSSYCTDDCILNSFCHNKQNKIEDIIYIEDFNCLRTQHFAKMAQFLKGGTMTDIEYYKIRNSTPIYNAIINITDDCNLCCPYCFTHQSNRIIDYGTLKSAIMFICKEMDKFPNFKEEPCINFFGGEPMLHFEDLIKPVIIWTEEQGIRKKYSLNFGMTSNGTLFTEENLKWLNDHEVNILLSIDGNKETQDSQRPMKNNQSSFDILNKEIPTILKYFPYTTFRSAIEPFNVDKIYENYLYARKMNFLHYFITPNLETTWSNQELATACEQLALISQTIYQDIANDNTPLIWGNLIANIIDVFMNLDKPAPIGYHHCGIGTTSIGISVDGTINGCQEHNTYTNDTIFAIGNIFTGIDINKHKRLLTEFQGLGHPVCFNNPNLCKTCSFYKDCAKNYCPSHNILANRKATENDYITCIWKSFTRDLAILFIEQAASEHNQKVINYLNDIVLEKIEKNNYSGW